MRHFFPSKAAKLLRLLSKAGYARGLRYGVAATIEHEDVMRALTPGTLVDVGANKGQFSLLARTLHPDLLIHAFEPLSAPARRYRRLFSHQQNVHLHPIAAGEASATAEIHVSGRADSSSLLPITDLQDKLFPGTAQASVETVRIERVDDILSEAALADPILVKLDVQGYELAALKGMPKLLARARHVYAEVSFQELYEGQPLAHEIIAWLASRGFRISGAYNPSIAGSGAAIQADLLFSKIDETAPL